MEVLSMEISECISGGIDYNNPNIFNSVTPIGITGVANQDIWGGRINANVPLGGNTYVSPNVTYVDPVGFVNPGIQVTHILD